MPNRPATIRYRSPTAHGAPMPGHIVMGDGKRTRRAYRVLSAKPSRGGLVALGCTTWRLAVEPMSAASGRAEIDAGCAHWGIVWDARKKGPRHG